MWKILFFSRKRRKQTGRLLLINSEKPIEKVCFNKNMRHSENTTTTTEESSNRNKSKVLCGCWLKRLKTFFFLLKRIPTRRKNGEKNERKHFHQKTSNECERTRTATFKYSSVFIHRMIRMSKSYCINMKRDSLSFIVSVCIVSVWLVKRKINLPKDKSMNNIYQNCRHWMLESLSRWLLSVFIMFRFIDPLGFSSTWIGGVSFCFVRSEEFRVAESCREKKDSLKSMKSQSKPGTHTHENNKTMDLV